MKPKFLPMDIVRILETGELAIIHQANRTSWSVLHINKNSESKVAWYDKKELEFVNNLYEILIESSNEHSDFKFSLKTLRRK